MINTQIINGKVYWIKECPSCGTDMPYSTKSNYYSSRKKQKRCRSCANPMKKPEVAAKFLGDKNPSKRKKFREWLSINNPMNCPEIKEKQKTACNNPVRREAIRNRMLLSNHWKTPEGIEKRTNTYTKRLSEGKYTIKNNWKTGFYVKDNGEQEWYDSSYELKRMKWYDENRISWTKKHKIRIPYISENGLKTYYVPDFFVNGNTIEEIKGWIKSVDIKKATVAIEFCKEKGWNYNFLLGPDHTKKEELSYGCQS